MSALPMARGWRALRRGTASVRGLLGSVTGGCYLILLYGFTVWLVVGSLSAIQIRETIREQQEDVSFGAVQRAHDRYLQVRGRLLDGLWELDPISAKQTQIEDAVALIQALDGDLELQPWDFAQSPRFRQIHAECRAASVVAGPGIANEPPVCGAVDEYGVLTADLRQLFQAGEHVRQAQLEGEILDQLKAQWDAEPLSRYFDMYDFLGFVPFYRQFLHAPSEILVLQLTIVMGMLGSVITMTWSFIKRDGGFTFRRFLILPFVGSMSAFIIFVFVKAGQLTLSSGNPSETLNPFVLSFVGIISGLLSERAYGRMADVGSRFFRADEDTARYGVRLRESMEGAGVTVEDVACHLRLSTDEADRILSEVAPASPLHQQLLGALLRRPIRDLFTDVPPDPAVADPA